MHPREQIVQITPPMLQIEAGEKHGVNQIHREIQWRPQHNCMLMFAHQIILAHICSTLFCVAQCPAARTLSGLMIEAGQSSTASCWCSGKL